MQNLCKKSFLALNIICSLGLSALDAATPTVPVHETAETTKTEKLVGTITSNLIAVGAIMLASRFLKISLPFDKRGGQLAKNVSAVVYVIARFGMAEASKRYINKQGFQSNALGLYILTNF